MNRHLIFVALLILTGGMCVVQGTGFVQAGADLLSHEVLDVEDFVEGAEVQRRGFNRMTPPGFSWVQPMSPPIVPFDAANFSDDFLNNLLGEDLLGVAVYPLAIELDPQTRETSIFNADGDLLATYLDENSPQNWPEGSDPSRIILTIDLLPIEDIAPFVFAQERLAAEIQDEPIVLRTPASTEFGVSSIQHLTNGNTRLTVTNGTTDAAEIFVYTVWHTSSVVVATWTNEDFSVETATNIFWTAISPPYNGLESEWEIATTNLVLTSGVGIWEDANISSNARVRFYATAQRADSDRDGLTDGVERFIHHTDAANPDSDGDGWNDGEELAAETNPNDRLDAPHLARNVLINAICYNPSSGFASSNQWVQLHSSCRYPVDLTGFRIQVAGSNFVTRFTFPDETWIQPGNFILIGGSNVSERDFTADLLLPQSYASLPTAGVRLLPPQTGMRSGGELLPSDVMMYGSHSPFNEFGLPTAGWGSTSTTLWAGSGYMLTRLSLGLDSDTRSDWTFQSIVEIYNSQTHLDSDKDGLDDGTEYSGAGNTRPPTDPLDPDSDGDGLEDDFEIIHGLDPNHPDTNGNGIGDGQEINPNTGNSYVLEQLAEGLTVAVAASKPGWTMGQSIGSNGVVQFTINSIDGIAIWATIREGGAVPEEFTSAVSNAVVAYSNSSTVAGFRTLNLLLVQENTNSPVVVTIRDGGTYWTNQTPQNIGPDISARFQAVRVRMDNGDSYYIPNSDYAYAYISGAPAMPDFFVNLTPENKIGGDVSWRGRISFSRDNWADVDYYPAPTWKTLPAKNVWDFNSAFGADIRGGTALFYCQLGGKISTNVMYIRGHNPTKNAVEALFAGAPWYALPLAKHESGFANSTYFQFNETGVLGPNPEDFRNSPNWGFPHGWGIMQLDGTLPNAQDLWDWESNVAKGLNHLNVYSRSVAVEWIARQETQQRAEDPMQPLENEVFVFNGIVVQKGTLRTPTDICTINAYNGATNWSIFWRNTTPTQSGAWVVNSNLIDHINSVCGRVDE